MDIYHINWLAGCFPSTVSPANLTVGWWVYMDPYTKDYFLDPGILLGGLPVSGNPLQVCKKGDETALEALIVCGLSGWKKSS